MTDHACSCRDSSVSQIPPVAGKRLGKHKTQDSDRCGVSGMHAPVDDGMAIARIDDASTFGAPHAGKESAVQ